VANTRNRTLASAFLLVTVVRRRVCKTVRIQVELDGEGLGRELIRRSAHRVLVPGSDNFLYYLQGGPEGPLVPPTRPAQPHSRSAPARLASDAGRLARRAKNTGPQNPEEVTEPRRI